MALPNHVKTVIIGAGIHGLSTAWHLAAKLEAQGKGGGRDILVIDKAGIEFELTVPHKAFHRNIGSFKDINVSPDGDVLTDEQWMQNVDRWLPTESDRAYVGSLMGRVVEAGKFANWIAPPAIGINRQPIDFEYVRFN